MSTSPTDPIVPASAAAGGATPKSIPTSIKLTSGTQPKKGVDISRLNLAQAEDLQAKLVVYAKLQKAQTDFEGKPKPMTELDTNSLKKTKNEIESMRKLFAIYGLGGALKDDNPEVLDEKIKAFHEALDKHIHILQPAKPPKIGTDIDTPNSNPTLAIATGPSANPAIAIDVNPKDKPALNVDLNAGTGPVPVAKKPTKLQTNDEPKEVNAEAQSATPPRTYLTGPEASWAGLLERFLTMLFAILLRPMIDSERNGISALGSGLKNLGEGIGGAIRAGFGALYSVTAGPIAGAVQAIRAGLADDPIEKARLNESAKERLLEGPRAVLGLVASKNKATGEYEATGLAKIVIGAKDLVKSGVIGIGLGVVGSDVQRFRQDVQEFRAQELSGKPAKPASVSAQTKPVPAPTSTPAPTPTPAQPLVAQANNVVAGAAAQAASGQNVPLSPNAMSDADKRKEPIAGPAKAASDKANATQAEAALRAKDQAAADLQAKAAVVQARSEEERAKATAAGSAPAARH